MPTRREFIGTLALAAAAGSLSRAAGAGQAAPALPAGFHELRRGVGIFIGPGGTIGWLATPDGAAAIDSQFPATAQACIDGLRQRSGRGIALLLNTHHHGDHTAGNPLFRPVVRQIVQHERCAALHRAAAQSGGADAQPGVADVTFTGAWSTTIGSERITAAYYGAAHTSGDAVIAFENANIVHVGDLVFNRIPPFVDRASGASISNWIVALEAIATKHRDATFIFGHGRNDAVIGSVRNVTYFRDYLTAVLDHVRRGIAAGRPAAEIASVTALPGFPEHVDLVKTYASAIPLFTVSHVLTAAYQELSAAR